MSAAKRKGARTTKRKRSAKRTSSGKRTTAPRTRKRAALSRKQAVDLLIWQAHQTSDCKFHQKLLDAIEIVDESSDTAARVAGMRKLRRTLPLSVPEAAAMAGVSVEDWARYESGKQHAIERAIDALLERWKREQR